MSKRPTTRTQDGTLPKQAATGNELTEKDNEVKQLTNKDSQIIHVVAQHLKQKYDDSSILFARKFRGGWEAWLQIELATELLKVMSDDPNGGVNGYVVERENQVWTANGTGKYDGTGKCDIWIIPGPNFDSKKKKAGVDVIELKVAYESGDRKELVRERMIADMNKVIYPLNIPAATATAGLELRPLCIGITSYPEDLTGDWSQGPAGAGPVKYMWIVKPNTVTYKGKQQDGLAMIWWAPTPDDMAEVNSAGSTPKRARRNKL